MSGISTVFNTAKSFPVKNLPSIITSLGKDASLLEKGGNNLAPLRTDVAQFSSKSNPFVQDTKAGKLFREVSTEMPIVGAAAKFEASPLESKMIQEVRAHGAQKETETMRIIKSDGTISDMEVIENKVSCKLKGSPEEITAVRRNAIQIHNHPRKGPLSPADVKNFIKYNQEAEIAVSPDGCISCIRNNNSSKDVIVIHNALEELEAADKARLKELGMLDESGTRRLDVPEETLETFNRFREAILRRFAEKTGYTYCSEGFSV